MYVEYHIWVLFFPLDMLSFKTHIKCTSLCLGNLENNEYDHVKD